MMAGKLGTTSLLVTTYEEETSGGVSRNIFALS